MHWHKLRPSSIDNGGKNRKTNRRLVEIGPEGKEVNMAWKSEKISQPLLRVSLGKRLDSAAANAVYRSSSTITSYLGQRNNTTAPKI
jgi:hypothetical protein